MARLNFEDSVFREQGFQDLMIEVRDRQKAKGIVIELWSIAQEFWFPNKHPIPLERFRAAGLPDALYLPGGLAELREDGVYAKGSEQAFLWLFQKSAAGKKPKKPRVKKPKIPKNSETGDNVRSSGDNGRSTAVNGSERDESSYSLLSSLTLCSNSNSDSNSLVSTPPKRAGEPTPVSKLRKLRIELHNQVHSCDPVDNAATNGMLANLVKAVGEREAPLVLQYFYKVPNNTYRTQAHNLKLLLNDTPKLLTEVRRQAPIIPDARANSFKKATHFESVKEEILRKARESDTSA